MMTRRIRTTLLVALFAGTTVFAQSPDTITDCFLTYQKAVDEAYRDARECEKGLDQLLRTCSTSAAWTNPECWSLYVWLWGSQEAGITSDLWDAILSYCWVNFVALTTVDIVEWGGCYLSEAVGG